MIRRTFSVGSDTRNGGSSASSLSPTTVVTPAQATNNFVGRRRSASESGGEWRVAISATHRRQTSPDQWTLYFEVAVENEKYTWSVLKSERQFEDLQALFLREDGRRSLRKCARGASTYMQAFEVLDPFFVETRRRTYEQVLVAFVLFALNRSISSSTASALWSFLDPAYERAMSFLDSYQKEGPIQFFKKSGKWKALWVYLKNGFLCLTKMQGDKRCKKFIPVHHSVLAAAASQDLAGKFGIALTTGTSLQKCYRFAFNTSAERKSWMVAIFEVQTRFFEFNPFREPTGDEQDESNDTPTGPSLPGGAAASGRSPTLSQSDPQFSRSLPALHLRPTAHSASSSPSPSSTSLRAPSPISTSASASTQSTHRPVASASYRGGVVGQAATMRSPPVAPARSARGPSPSSSVSAIAGRFSPQPGSTTNQPHVPAATLRPATAQPAAALPQAPAAQQRSSPQPIVGTNQVRSTLLAAQQQQQGPGQVVSRSPPRSGRAGTKRLPPPPGPVSSLACKHPSQRFTPEEMSLLWDALEGEQKEMIYDARSQDSRTLEGRLKMQGRKLKRWKEYLFRMDRAGAITYNPPAGPIKDKRRIPLRGASVIEAEAEGVYAWSVVTPSRQFTIGADTEAAKIEWMRATQDAINQVMLVEREGLLQRNSAQNEIKDVSSRSAVADYPKAASGDAQMVKAATLEALLKHLFSPECDLIFFKTFLLTYRSFTKPESFFETLKRCFATGKVEVSSTSSASSPAASTSPQSGLRNGSFSGGIAAKFPPATSPQALALVSPRETASNRPRGGTASAAEKKGKNDELLGMQQRVCVVLKQWIAVGYADFSVKMKSAMMAFVEGQLTSDYALVKETKELRAVLQYQMGNEAARNSLFIASSGQEKRQFSDMSAEVVAQHLTLIQFEYFRRIRAHEFLNQAWNKPPMKTICANLLSSIDHFNEVSQWVVHTILCETALAERAKLLSKMIQIAELLLKYNNFCGVMAFVAAFHSAAVSRLKRTWEKVSSSQRKVVDKLTEIFSPTQSFKNYRAAIRSAKRPGCPYVGTFLMDLVYLEEVNPDTIMSGTRELINFAKRRAIYEVISQVLYFRDEPYSFKVDQAVGDSLASMLASSEVVRDPERLSEISRQIEPKEQQGRP